MILPTARLVLRPQVEGDHEAILRVAPPRSGESLEARAERLKGHAAVSDRWFADFGYGVWVLEPPGTAGLLGFVGAKPNDTPARPELMYGLSESARGRGLAAEAAQAVVRHLFSLPGTTEVWAQTDPDNVASRRVMERLGMRFDFRGMFQDEDSVVYRVTRADHDTHAGALVAPTPWSLPEILHAMAESTQRTADYFAGIPAAEFVLGEAEHWGPARHLGHLILTHTQIGRGLRLGARLPAHPSGRSRGLHELGRAAFAALSAAPREAILANPLSPPTDGLGNAPTMARQLLEANAALRATAAGWAEHELDARALQHPYMGPVTVREMLLFILMHDRHHVSGVRRQLSAR